MLWCRTSHVGVPRTYVRRRGPDQPLGICIYRQQCMRSAPRQKEQGRLLAWDVMDVTVAVGRWRRSDDC